LHQYEKEPGNRLHYSSIAVIISGSLLVEYFLKSGRTSLIFDFHKKWQLNRLNYGTVIQL